MASIYGKIFLKQNLHINALDNDINIRKIIFFYFSFSMTTYYKIFTGLEAIVVMFVIGFIVSTARQFFVEGWKRFFSAPWHW